MTIKLAVLKTGEHIISDVKEAYYQDELTCYIFEEPCDVIINSIDNDTGEHNSDNNRISISLYPWPPLSSDTSVQVTPDSIITMVEPNVQLKEIYQNRNTKND